MRNSRFAFVAVFVASGICRLPCAGQDAADFPYSLAISTENGKTEFLSLLPVVLTLELKNETQTTQSLENAFGAEDFAEDIGRIAPRFRVMIDGPDGSGDLYYADWVNWNWNFRAYSTSRIIGPGKVVRMDYCLGMGFPKLPDRKVTMSEIYPSLRSAFPKPGLYRVQMALPRLGTACSPSNVLDISIIEPAAGQSRLAYDTLSQSCNPEIFLKPSGAELAGPEPLTWIRKPGLYGPDLERFLRESFLTGRRIVTECPESVYAPYARLFWSYGLATGQVEFHVDGQYPGPIKRSEGIGLLRDCGQDPALPIRYRQSALALLAEQGRDLSGRMRSTAVPKIPSVASILGLVDLSGLTDFAVLRHAYLAVNGRQETRSEHERILARRFTTEQIEKLKAAATTNPAIAQALGMSALQDELTRHASWAREELDRWALERPDYVRLQVTGSGVNL